MADLAGRAWLPIETMFTDRRARPPDLAGACAAAARAIAGDTPEAVRAALAALAAAAEPDAAAPGTVEPAYHGRHHVAEATLAMAWLCAAARSARALDGPAAFCGVLAMAGHDLLHDGSVAPGGALEARSAAAVDPILAGAGLGPDTRARVARIILATESTRAPVNAAALRATPDDPDALLAVLANEADLAASLMPGLGPRLGALLAAEWRAAGVPGAAAVGTHAGRLAFLRGIPPFSQFAVALGLAAARDTCLAAYAALGESPEQGAAHLDTLPAAQAAAAYDAAISRAGCTPRPTGPAAAA